MPPPAQICFHCGEPLPGGQPLLAVLTKGSQEVCCAGCKAVAELIDAQGLGGYYQSRTALPATVEVSTQARAEDALYDRPEVQEGLVRAVGEGEKETTLLLEGITCSACLWLNERHLQSLPGVVRADVNYATRRVHLRWRAQDVQLSTLLGAVRAIGYRAYPSTAQAGEALRRREERASLWRMAVAGLGMMQVMMYALPAYVADEGSMTSDIGHLLRWASLILTLPVMVYSCAPFFRGAWRDLRNRTLGMDVPVALGLLVAFMASVYATISTQGEVYFDSISMFAFLLLLGRHLEHAARQKAARGLEYVARALPVSARRLRAFPDNESEEILPAASLTAGDVVSVRAGEVFPADGVIVRGETEADESLLTGESRPVFRARGSAVVAGAVNRVSPVVMRVERAGEHSRASHIARLMERAAAERPRLAQVTDRVASWFVLAVLIIAALTGLGWYWIDASKALWTMVAVLVVTCPCALSLATPTVLAIATATLARRGMVVTRSHAIEALAGATHFAFDKTGTLTEGRLRLVQSTALQTLSAAQALRIAAAMEMHSEHPIGRALVAKADTLTAGPSVDGLRNVPGGGIEAYVDGHRYRLGHARFVAGLDEPDLSGGWLTRVWLGDEGGLLARFDFADNLRQGARSTIDALRRAGRVVLLLSGDAPPVVARTAQAVGITDYQGGLDPEAKLARVRALQAAGAKVVMVGDGINDAPVLAQAHLSVAMGAGAVLAQAHADVVMTSPDLGALEEGMRTARRAMGVMKQNLIWALGYNLLAIPLAVSGWLTPWMAGVGMAASSLLVVLNALRLLRVPKAPTSTLTPALALTSGA